MAGGKNDAAPKRRGNAGKGRPPGSRNKTTLAAKAAIMAAAEGLGGVDALVAWAQKDEVNERLFWSSIYPKLLPFKVDGEIEAGPNLARALLWQPPTRS